MSKSTEKQMGYMWLGS